MNYERLLYLRGYRITELGKCINPIGTEISGYVVNTGYIAISFRYYGKSRQCSIHRMQAFQKYGELIYNKGIEARHKNGIKTDNSYVNILIGTHSQNMMDIPESIRISKAIYAASFVKKYNKKEVREFYDKCKSYKKTMIEFNISSKGTLYFILNK